MTREEFNQADVAIVKRGEPLASITCLRDEYILSLEQQNTALQARIKELEANEDKLKREWYTIGSNDNYNALKNNGKLRL